MAVQNELIADEPLSPQEVAAEEKEEIQFDLTAPEYYLNRELTWLEFNKRVLNEARDPRNPLLERLKFIAIISSNMDEFFMKRLGGLKQQQGAGVSFLTVDGRSPREQIDEATAVVREMEVEKRKVYDDIMDALNEHDIAISLYETLTDDERTYLREDYYQNIYPLVTPQAISKRSLIAGML